jgi:superfamily II DNA or RNA helicase
MIKSIFLPPQYSINHRDSNGNLIVRLLSKEVAEDADVTNVKVGRNKGKLIKLQNDKEVLVLKNKKAPVIGRKGIFSKDLTIPSNQADVLAAGSNLGWIKPKLNQVNFTISDPLKILAQSARDSWKDKFVFSEEEKIDDSETKKGFRSAQIGALHATLGHWKVSNKPATVVMPTGTGKTETMLGLFVHQRLERLLVVVPTDALRTQISQKFLELGLLHELNMLKSGVEFPLVGILKHRPKTEEELTRFFESCNVVVTTIGVVGGLPEVMQRKISQLCSHLFIDEAHHIPAPTWDRFRSYFKDKTILQFTATPYRTDGRHIDGKLIYNFPLNKAQEDGYFKHINFIALREYDQTAVDKAIAVEAIGQLEKDLAQNYDHIVMARADNKKRADEIIKIYENLAPSHKPVVIHTGVIPSERKQRLSQVHQRQSRIIVCVDMFGEGFDFPEFKIAALHDIHKSLAITLQFTGRFVRTKKNIGDATMIANIVDPDVQDALRELFSEDANWNKILRKLSQGGTDKEEKKSEFFEGFTDVPDEIPIENILPKMSTVVFKTDCPQWHPEKVTQVIKGSRIYAGPTTNPQHHVSFFVTREQEKLDWANLKEMSNTIWNIYLFYWDQEQNLLYINSSNNKSHHEALAEAVTGAGTSLIKGEEIFRTLKGINRLVLMNVGLKHVLGKAVRFTMHAGLDVSGGLADAQVQHKIKSNLFGRGYEGGGKATIGCSYKGRVWAYKIADSIDEWMDWCNLIGKKLLDSSANPDEILKNALVPVAVTSRPPLVPLSIDWSEEVFLNFEEVVQFDFSGTVVPFFETSIDLEQRSSTGPILFSVSTEGLVAKYEMKISSSGVKYVLKSSQGVMVNLRGKQTTLSEWLELYPPSVLFEDTSMLVGDQLFQVNANNTLQFNPDKITPKDWSGVDITKESQTSLKFRDTVQYKVIHDLLSDTASYDIVFDDDGSGEAADIVAIKLIDENLTIHLFHCKYSHRSTSGARIDDLYEVCGQAQKSVNWKYDLQKLLRHLRKRETTRLGKGKPSRFEKGDMRLLNEIEAKSPILIPDFKIFMVQPGLSKTSVSADQMKLLASTELYLQETFGVPLEVISNS